MTAARAVHSGYEESNGEGLRLRVAACLGEDGVGSVVFAHKTTEGWEALLLSGMIRGGWTITGSWPIATEMAFTSPTPVRPHPWPPASTSSAALGRKTPQ